MVNNTTGKLLMAALTVATFAIPVSVQAEWTGGIEGGTVLDGDQTGSLLRLNVSNNERPFNQQFYLDWIRGSSGGNSYRLGYEPQYWITDQIYAFGEASIRTERNSSFNIDQRTRLFGGLGVELLNSKSTNLYVEAGLGQSNTKFTTPNSEDQDVTTTLARFGASHTLTDYLKLELNGEYSTSDPFDLTTGEAGLSLRVAGGAIKYTYRVRNFEAEGQDAIDTTSSAVSYSYSF